MGFTRYNWRNLSDTEKEKIIADIKNRDTETMEYMSVVSRKSGFWKLVRRANKEGITLEQITLYLLSYCCWLADQQRKNQPPAGEKKRDVLDMMYSYSKYLPKRKA